MVFWSLCIACFIWGLCWPTITGSTHPQWSLSPKSCTGVQTWTIKLKFTSTWRCGHEPTLWVIRDLSKITWRGTGKAGKHPKRTLRKAPKLSFKCPSLWLSIRLSGVIWACQIIYNSLLDPRASDLLFWAHGEPGFWPAKKNNPARQPSSQTPSGCASLDIDISLTLSFPLQHELLITWIPSGISYVVKE